jgi:hypothetical protein
LEDGKGIEGTVHNTGTHAADIIITEHIVENILPITLQEGVLTTQYAKEDVEDLGLLKMDFLGLTTLIIIADTEGFIRRDDSEFSMDKIAYDDEDAYELLNSEETVGVFNWVSRRGCVPSANVWKSAVSKRLETSVPSAVRARWSGLTTSSPARKIHRESNIPIRC